ncbi:MAG: NAD-dependent epimerase/dehydratase family protein, partial [Bacteroidota bacterium]
MKVLIIGSLGFIGQHCVHYLSQLGAEVWQADILPSKAPRYFQLEKTNTDFQILFTTQQFDACINASGSAHVGFSFYNPEVDFELNVLNVNKLLVAIRRHNPTCKLINFSSAAIYGNP